MSWITPTLIASLCTLLGTVLGSVQAVSHRSRKRIRQLSAQVDSLEEWVWTARHEVNVFNAGLPDDVGPVVLPELPEFLGGASAED